MWFNSITLLWSLCVGFISVLQYKLHVTYRLWWVRDTTQPPKHWTLAVYKQTRVSCTHVTIRTSTLYIIHLTSISILTNTVVPNQYRYCMGTLTGNIDQTLMNSLHSLLYGNIDQTLMNSLHSLLYGNIDQTLMNSLHSLLYGNIDQTLMNSLHSLLHGNIDQTLMNSLHSLLHGNIDQRLMNSLHSLLNFDIGGLDCFVITTEYISFVIE